jgi:pilus assembly protein FimV
LALAFLLLPSLALAAGLGKLTVFSGLGQPLKAEIELLALHKGEAADLSVRLPPAEAFRKANVDYSGALLSVRFSIEPRGDDRYVVVLSSGEPINEPFLDLLVELDWKTGRLVREYTFLLDPPEYQAPQAAPAMAAPVTGTAEIKGVEMPKPGPAAAPPGAAQAPVSPAPAMAPAPAKSATAKTTYEVQRGDTLTKIANANRTDRVSLQQMLIALYRANAGEFDDDNINRIRAGKILNIPDMDEAASIDPDEAGRTVLAHAADFNEYRRKLAAAVSAAPERAEQRRQRVSGKITAKVEEQPAASAEVKDRLRLSKAEEPGKPGAQRSSQGLQEDLIAKEKELREANERIAMLEKNVTDMQKLIELKSQSGAQLQQQAEQAGAAKAPKAPEPSKAPEPARAPEPAKTPEPAKAEAPAQAAAPPPPQAAPQPKAAAPKPKPKVVAPPPPPPETSLLDEILANELALYGGGGFLLLLFIGYGYYAWRRKKALQMENSVMASSELAVDSVFGAVGGARVDTGEAEGPADLSQTATTAAMETEEVDPIAEAEVYMAYGRDTQAEEILKDALAKDASRQPIRGKLLEIYANRKDVAAFGAMAAALHAASGGEGPEWTKAVALGAQLDPGNPLYAGAGAGGGEAQAGADTQVVPATEAAPEASQGLDFDLGMGEAAPAGTPRSEEAAASDVTADLGFDLDLGDQDKEAAGAQQKRPPAPAQGGEAKVAEAPADTSSSIDFDFELPGANTEQQPAVEPPPAAGLELPQVETAAPAPAEGSGGIDFDFNLDLPAQKEEAPSAPLDLSSISLDLGAPGEPASAPDAHWQEVATKLDLAKAYQEMGDKDGARELLNEVLKEGDDAQKQQAQTILAALG